MKTRYSTMRSFGVVCLSVLCALWLRPASAASWTYPDEISVAEAYNDIYFTTYDTTTQEGLAALVADHGSAMSSSWSVSTATAIVVLSMDSSSTDPVGILVSDTFIPLFYPGPWTPPSRGWFDDPLNETNWAAGIIDIRTVLTNNGFAATTPFAFVVGSTVMDATNTYRINGNNTNPGFLLGYNESGLNGGDGDANEPIIYVKPPTSLPGTCDGMRPTMVGTTSRDIITIPEGMGTQVLMALGGNDVIYGSSGDDIICGGDGGDIIYGKGGNNTLFGDAGDDRLFGGEGVDVIHGGVGDDTILAGPGNDQVYGDAGNDTIKGEDGDDSIDGGDGNDRLFAGSGNDIVIGGTGNDQLTGDDGDDQLDGGDGADELIGGYGDDTLIGGTGDDYIYGQYGNDDVDGGDGYDRCDGGPGDVDTESNCEYVTGFEIVN